MREIKFRGKRIDNGEWVEGYLFEHVWKNGNLSYIIKGGFVPAISMPSKVFIEVDPKTVGQFTGLKDKNGVEIYEGDIIKIKHPHKDREFKGVVEFNDYCFMVKDFCFTHFDNPYDIFSEGTEYIEVAGNTN